MNALHVNQLLTNPTDVLRVAGALLGVIVALYLLRPRKRRVEVPFGGLWQKVLAESESRVMGRNFQRLLSFLLMLLVAGLCVASLADPLFGPSADAPRREQDRPHTVVVVDVSASMQTQDGQDGTRLAEAQSALRKWLLAAPPEEDVLLMAASGHAEVLAGWGSDRATLEARVAELQATDGALDLRRAIDTAQQALGHRQQPRIVLVSDAGPPELPLEVTPAVAIEHLRVGPARAWQPGQPVPRPTLSDLAVTELRIRPDAADPSRGTLTVQVRNDSNELVAAQLVLAASDTAYDAATFAKTEALRRIVDVQLPPGLSTQIVPGVDLTSARFAVQVRNKTGLHDLAPWDDWGFAVLAERRELGVLLVSGGDGVDPTVGDLYLDAALFAHGKVKVQHIAAVDYRPESFAARDRARHGVDVVVLDQAGFALPEGTPGLILSLAGAATETVRLAEGPELVVRDEEHPAMRGITFVDTNFDKVRLIPSRPGDVVLAAVKAHGALPKSQVVMVARQDGVRSLEWGIDLLETDLGARYSLPLLVSNALLWLAGQEEALVPPLLVGRPWAVDAPVDGTWQYIEPGQPPRPARTSGRQLLGQSERQGVHVWRSDGDRIVARATVLPPTENPVLLQPWGPSARTLPARPVVVKVSHGLQRWSLWLLAALVLLAVEWLTYLRRRTV